MICGHSEEECCQGRQISRKTTGNSGADREGVDGGHPGAVRKIADKLLKMNNAQRAAVPGIGPRRSEIITGGAQVFAMLLERMGLKWAFVTRRSACATACWRRCSATPTSALQRA